MAFPLQPVPEHGLSVSHEICDMGKSPIKKLPQVSLYITCIERFGHAGKPLVAFRGSDGKWCVPCTKAWMTMAFHIQLGTTKPSTEKLEELLPGLSQILLVQ